ncbi:MAG: LysM domain-containing protein [Chloroflexota bacterium]
MAEKSSASPIIYTVKPGDNLTHIARTFAADAGLSESDLVQQIYELNKGVIGDDKNKIRAGQALQIPVGVAQGREVAGGTAVSTPTPIKVGSIIHLQSNLPQGGYLETRGSITDKPVITKWHDPHIRTFVSTHTNKNRDKGSGSWKILSATGKPDGQPLVDGDTIYLLNMRPNVGYLDTFEWVRNLEPFKQYDNMTIGVFTADVPRRGGGVSGVWTIRSQAGSAIIQNGATVYLENLFPGAGHLVAHGDVTQHKLFTDYDGQRHFVFTTPYQNVAEAAYSWTVALSAQQTENIIHTYHVWHEQGGEFVEAGAFNLTLPHNQPILALNLKSYDGGQTLTGQVNETIQIITATWRGEGYHVTASSDQSQQLVWQFGGQVTELTFKRNDTEPRRIDGTLTFAHLGATAVKFKAIQALALNWQQFFASSLWESRIKKISVALEAVGLELDRVLSLTDGQAVEDEAAFLQSQLAHMQQLHHNMGAFWQLFSQRSTNHINTVNQTGLLPPVHLIKACFQEFTVDFEILQRAIEQRRWSSGGSNAQAQSLVVTDKLAAMALTPFQHLITDSSDVIPITYFSQTIHIRRLPYVDNFVLVGLTYDLSVDSLPEGSSPFELMAIPHEVGHFIYHHGKLKPDKKYSYESLASVREDEQFAEHPYRHWFEEIFADLYGCMVAGPLTALGLLALLATGDKERLLLDDEEHPTPILRPFFLSEMLRILSEKSGSWQAGQKTVDFANVAKSLDANWTTLLERWGFVTEGVANGRPAKIQIPSQTKGHWEGFMNVETAVAHVRTIIQKFVDLLSHTYQKQQNKPPVPWCKTAGELDDFIEEIKELPRSKHLAGKKVISLVNKKPEQVAETVKGRLPILAQKESEISAATFHTILKGWEDSGPTGHGDHPD